MHMFIPHDNDTQTEMNTDKIENICFVFNY